MAAEKWESAISEITKASPQDFENLCHLTADKICRDGALDPGKFMSFWSLETWWQIQGLLTSVMKKAAGKNWSTEMILDELGSLDQTYKKVIVDAVGIHKVALRQKLAHDTATVSHSVLADFDWKLKLSLASDKLALLQEPLLQLDLDVRDSNGKKRLLNIELDKGELAKLISSLESCSKSVQQLTVTS